MFYTLMRRKFSTFFLSKILKKIDCYVWKQTVDLFPLKCFYDRDISNTSATFLENGSH